MELEQQLASVPLLAGLDSRIRHRLAETGKRRTYGADDEIVREGSNGTALYIVLSGEGRVERGGERLGSGRTPATSSASSRSSRSIRGRHR